MLTLLLCTMQNIGALVICHRRGKIVSSLWSTVGYRCDGDIIDIVLVAYAGGIDVCDICDINRFPALRFITGDDCVCDIDRAILDGAVSVLAAEKCGCLFQLFLVGVFDGTCRSGNTTRLGRRVHWGNYDRRRSRGTRGGARACRICGEGSYATGGGFALPLGRSVGEHCVEGLDR